VVNSTWKILFVLVCSRVRSIVVVPGGNRTSFIVGFSHRRILGRHIQYTQELHPYIRNLRMQCELVSLLYDTNNTSTFNDKNIIIEVVNQLSRHLRRYRL